MAPEVHLSIQNYVIILFSLFIKTVPIHNFGEDFTYRLVCVLRILIAL